MKFSYETIINAPAEKVWKILVEDIEGWSDWIPSIQSVRIITPGPVRVGAKYEIKANLKFFTAKIPLEITGIETERAVEMKAKSFLGELRRFYYLESQDKKTRITIGGDISGPVAWFGFGAKQGVKISKEIALAAKNKIENQR